MNTNLRIDRDPELEPVTLNTNQIDRLVELTRDHRVGDITLKGNDPVAADALVIELAPADDYVYEFMWLYTDGRIASAEVNQPALYATFNDLMDAIIQNLGERQDEMRAS